MSYVYDLGCGCVTDVQIEEYNNFVLYTLVVDCTKKQECDESELDKTDSDEQIVDENKSDDDMGNPFYTGKVAPWKMWDV